MTQVAQPAQPYRAASKPRGLHAAPTPIAKSPRRFHDGGMGLIDQRRHVRRRVDLAARIAPAPDTTAIVDLSEGGAALAWDIPDSVHVGSTVRLQFLLAGGQSLELDARVVRIAQGRAGVAFLDTQQDVVRQLLAEARSAD
jgi:hypothetical protein